METIILDLGAINGQVSVQIIRKNIKNVHLKVFRNLDVVLSVPMTVPFDWIDSFLNNHIEWIDDMKRKEDTARRITRRKYEEKHKERRKEINGSFGTMMPRALCDEINEFLRVNNITKVKLIVEGYEALKQKMNSVTQEK